MKIKMYIQQKSVVSSTAKQQDGHFHVTTGPKRFEDITKEMEVKDHAQAQAEVVNGRTGEDRDGQWFDLIPYKYEVLAE